MRTAASEAAGAALEALGHGGVSHGAHVELILRHVFGLMGGACLHLPEVQQHMLNLVYRSAVQIFIYICLGYRGVVPSLPGGKGTKQT